MDVNRLLEGFLGSGSGAARGGTAERSQSSGLPGGLAGGAAAGGLIALVLGTKTGRKLGGKALKYGGMAAVGGLAYKAYRDWQGNRAAGAQEQPARLPAPPPGSGFDVENDSDAGGQDFRIALMHAMISAAKSDAHIDQEEHGRIRDQIRELGLGAEEKAALFDLFSAPSDPASVARLARTSEQRAEIYLASVLAVDPDTPEERRYLDDLARQLDLPAGLRDHLVHEASAARREMQA
ncbi:tellurite resistance TerB family protein (plasmid) [Paroceanicella profunda]|uniref:Tellurite resistance TerB family protein n=1 Tax=Paroceanicella profunda TaxID=2579971 RepID=A0A5B8FZB4_9RHOB|nr:tellurite resistance TerB family protein [Paroceanicella profunda]QDL93815.1 tellurite resistance TerB family protein [Paroceanicella profunda]